MIRQRTRFRWLVLLAYLIMFGTAHIIARGLAVTAGGEIAFELFFFVCTVAAVRGAYEL